MRTLIISLLLTICFAIPATSNAQSEEAEQLLLNVEKLAQLKGILKNMYEGYRVVSKGYTTIKDISQDNYTLHQDFFVQPLF